MEDVTNQLNQLSEWSRRTVDYALAVEKEYWRVALCAATGACSHCLGIFNGLRDQRRDMRIALQDAAIWGHVSSDPGVRVLREKYQFAMSAMRADMDGC